MSRDEIIQLLLVETVHQVVEYGRTKWLLDVLEHGFAGFANMRDTELEDAVNRLGMSMHDDNQGDDNEASSHYENLDDTHTDFAFATGYSGRQGIWALDTD